MSITQPNRLQFTSIVFYNVNGQEKILLDPLTLKPYIHWLSLFSSKTRFYFATIHNVSANQRQCFLELYTIGLTTRIMFESRSVRLFILIFAIDPTSHSMTKLKTTWPALYNTKTLFSLKGFRLAITLGPRYVTIYRYVMTMKSVGNGLSINGQSLTRGSVLKTKNTFKKKKLMAFTTCLEVYAKKI